MSQYSTTKKLVDIYERFSRFKFESSERGFYVTLRKKTKIDRPLTEVELELMKVIWDLGECSIRDVHNALSPERGLAYTTVATMMKILEQKKFIAGRKKE